MTERTGDHLHRTEPAWTVLQDKILVHTRAAARNGTSPALSVREHDGVILCGAGSLAAAGTFHRQAPGGRLQLVDPDSYGAYATADAPFQLDSLHRNGQQSLFEEDEAEELRHNQQGQLSNGAAAGLTPTRYIGAGDRRAVAAAVETARDLDARRTVLTLPLDHRWLREPGDLEFLIAQLAGLPHIKGIALGAARNPLAARGSVTALRYLIDSLERVALLRTDLAGLDAYAHGALFASIGMQTALRHVRKPDSVPPPAPKGGNVTTMVLHPQLMDYFKADRLRDLYGRLPAPLCHCSVCEGRSLIRFDHNQSDQEEANRHNIATWLPWADSLQRTMAGSDRRGVWQRLCHDAREAHQQLREEVSDPGALTTPRWLDVWAGDPD
ncbi:hypothetical protein GPA10_10570 [Streptomyces sp. p1417]|uniref:tRNA-guanine family transglycosylase n=1 Tax=Streptomyces typhae TaxID=2681492 RepID=A0A6L6WT03_9ACTN|nr:hypothetical protein [Streptomyces typhae]MVO85183.1 hypothetical protein [Streptomyces typhae]